jgi:3-oxoacyl-[acyl-carrier protein] reductase
LREPSFFLVSGGSGGIGAATCQALATAGYRPLVGYARNADAAAAVAARTGGEAISLDLAEDSAIDAAIDQIARGALPLAGVVLAASPPPVIGAFGKIAEADMALQWRINVDGPRRLVAGLVRHCLRKRKAGAVIGVLSAAMGQDQQRAATGMGAYIIAKYGLQGLLAVVQAEYPWLRVGSVRPGYTETPMLKAFDDRFIALQRERAPFETPESVAELIVAEAMGR